MWYVMQVQTGNEEIVIQLCEQMVDSSKYKHIFSPKCVTLKKYQGEWRELFVRYFRDISLLIRMRAVLQMSCVLVMRFRL